jgi:serine/threonine protein kinase
MMDIKNDIWSYGCILIDIYSKENPIFKINITKKEILEGNKFPLIPKDITGLMKDIISRCLDPNYETRINITELDTLMNVFLDNSNKSNYMELKKRISKICR